jgi:FMN-dependent NADH-azoreductase
MSTLIKFDSSPMADNSVSRKLTASFAETWARTHSGGAVINRDLTTMGLSPVDQAWIVASHTPAETRTSAQNVALAFSDSLISDLENADEYVFGVPMHNFSIPSTLKLWIDQVARAGKTFSYTAAGPRGLLLGKKATIIATSGGVYEHGTAMASFNFVAPYLRAVFGFIGVTDVTIISAEGTAQLMNPKVEPHVFLAPSFEKVTAHASL